MSVYSKEIAMGKRYICTQGLMSFRARPAVIITNGVYEVSEAQDILALPLYKREEIYEFAKTYTDKLFVTEHNGISWVISPSLFPSSSLCAVFRFDMTPSVLCRLIKECGAQAMFEFSEYAEIETVRISKKLRALAFAFSEFCAEMRTCFYRMDRLKGCDGLKEQRDVLAEQCYRLSLFCGCPIELEIDEGDFSKTDLPLFTAFVMTMLMSARKNARDRCARLKVSSMASAAVVSVSFDSDISLCISKEMLEWRAIAADRCMAFLPVEEQGRIAVEFHPCRYDLAAIFRIKQGEAPFLMEEPYA